MTTKSANIASVRILPDDVANKIAAGEVVERPASVVKELIENSLDAGATRITVRVVAAGRRLIEVIDNGHGMSEQNALLAIERHATSKIRKADDLEAVKTMGFRGEALASIASVSRFELVTRREKDDAATRIRIDGGILRDVEETGAPPGTRVTVNRLYFNTPVRAKFLKGITTELGHCIDIVQRHALSHEGAGFQFTHNDRLLLDVPEHASLRDRVALVWGLNYVQDMTEIQGQAGGFRIRGIIGLPDLTRAQRSHQFFFINQRPVINRSLQYGFEEAFRGLLTIGRHPVGVLMLDTHPRFVDVNIHPTKREVRFRDERAARDAIRTIVREQLQAVAPREEHTAGGVIPLPGRPLPETDSATRGPDAAGKPDTRETAPLQTAPAPAAPVPVPGSAARETPVLDAEPAQTEIPGVEAPDREMAIQPGAAWQRVGALPAAPLQIFDTYLLVPEENRLLIIDQHALHERLNYDTLMAELQDQTYESQQLAVPVILEVAPSQTRLVEANLDLLQRLGLEIEPFGGNTFQVTAMCPLYDESRVGDVFYQILDTLGQGDLFDREDMLADMLRLATRACKSSIRAGDRLTPRERKALLDGFHRLQPPYTCPHGRPIIVELTQRQMEKSFRRIQ
jgi:DNA mismatch repair protein MutL